MMNAMVKLLRHRRLNGLDSSMSRIRKKTVIMSCFKRHSSALYVSGKIANKVFAFLTPYFDVGERFANIEKLQEEITLRGMDVDVVQLRDLWEFYRKMLADRRALEDRLREISKSKSQLTTGEQTHESEVEFNRLSMQQRIIYEDFKSMKQAIWDMDDNVVQRVLKLPNKLDPRTPTVEPVVLRNVGNAPSSETADDCRDHIEIGEKLGLLKYYNPMLYYLCNKMALFELGVLAHASRVLTDGNNMVKVVGADFGRSLVVEGSGLDHEDPMTAFFLENHEEVERGSMNRMHLVGGASIFTFLTLHAKKLINPKDFPLKYLATGRQYVPLPANSQPCGLFTVCQASAVHVFVNVKDGKSEEYGTLFDELVGSVCQLYDDLCDHYRVVMKSAPQLETWESLRVSFELWSPFAKQYVEVGHLSACGDYFSKRLITIYQTPTGTDFPATITGTVLSVPRLIGCLLEQNPHEFVIPPKVAEMTPSDDCK